MRFAGKYVGEFSPLVRSAEDLHVGNRYRLHTCDSDPALVVVRSFDSASSEFGFHEYLTGENNVLSLDELHGPHYDYANRHKEFNPVLEVLGVVENRVRVEKIVIDDDTFTTIEDFRFIEWELGDFSYTHVSQVLERARYLREQGLPKDHWQAHLGRTDSFHMVSSLGNIGKDEPCDWLIGFELPEKVRLRIMADADRMKNEGLENYMQPCCFIDGL